jgi:hypothetical protein
VQGRRSKVQWSGDRCIEADIADDVACELWATSPPPLAQPFLPLCPRHRWRGAVNSPLGLAHVAGRGGSSLATPCHPLPPQPHTTPRSQSCGRATEGRAPSTASRYNQEPRLIFIGHCERTRATGCPTIISPAPPRPPHPPALQALKSLAAVVASCRQERQCPKLPLVTRLALTILLRCLLDTLAPHRFPRDLLEPLDLRVCVFKSGRGSSGRFN